MSGFGTVKPHGPDGDRSGGGRKLTRPFTSCIELFAHPRVHSWAPDSTMSCPTLIIQVGWS